MNTSTVPSLEIRCSASMNGVLTAAPIVRGGERGSKVGTRAGVEIKVASHSRSE
jgi:hypothetical protein